MSRVSDSYEICNIYSYLSPAWPGLSRKVYSALFELKVRIIGQDMLPRSVEGV